jgi:hypothetical protein
MGETIGSHGLHRLDGRVARWLLVRHDRARGDEIRVRHDEIADSLGVRRASITDCLHIIEGDGHLRCRRGRITIRDRAQLVQMAGVCYGAAEAHYRSFFGPFGKCAASLLPAAVNPGDLSASAFAPVAERAPGGGWSGAEHATVT